MLRERIKKEGLSILDFSIISGVPYTTLQKIVSHKTDIRKCNMETGYKIAKALDISMDELYMEEKEPDPFDYVEYDVFKSNVCHEVKRLGELGFVEKSLTEDYVGKYWKTKNYPEAYYMLAMTDFLSERNNVPLFNGYHNYRQQKLSEMIFPMSAMYEMRLNPDKKEEIRSRYIDHAEPAFLKYGIVEGDIFNVC